MHMADALLSPGVGAAAWVGSLGAIGYASKRLREASDERLVPLMGVMGAFIFSAQMINFTIPGTGSSGHLGGGLMLAIALGSHASFLVMASVLTVQALFFADGGLLALGCNIWNLGIYPCYIAYPLLFRPLAGDLHSPGRTLSASLVAAIAALQMGALSVVMQTTLSARSELPTGAFLLLMQPIHLAIGVVEGLATAAVVGYIRRARPETLRHAMGNRVIAHDIPIRRLLVTLAIVALIGGGALSWLASTRPDGLEWSIARIAGGSELPTRESRMTEALKGVQQTTAFLPDYGFRPKGDPTETAEGAPSWPGVDAGRSLSGILGSAIVLGAVLAIGICIRHFRHFRHLGRKRPSLTGRTPHGL